MCAMAFTIFEWAIPYIYTYIWHTNLKFSLNRGGRGAIKCCLAVASDNSKSNNFFFWMVKLPNWASSKSFLISINNPDVKFIAPLKYLDGYVTNVSSVLKKVKSRDKFCTFLSHNLLRELNTHCLIQRFCSLKFTA